ncbi:helicase associated domain-containing protein [Kitasatospora sp. NPDC101157]|uniref:helicase associated domain-containing protein n=1 Tax=Kitasatospora sp. NPDC101157 TaxID=3364098 RepID=UPI00382BB6A7
MDELWRLEPDWNRSYRRLLAYLAAGGTLDGPVNRTGLGDDPAFRPGAWLRKQGKARSEGKLTEQQTALLAVRDLTRTLDPATLRQVMGWLERTRTAATALRGPGQERPGRPVVRRSTF